MTNEIELTVPTTEIIEKLEETGDYKVFEDNKDGIADAIDWIVERNPNMYIADSEIFARSHLLIKMLHDTSKLYEFGNLVEENCTENELIYLLGPIYSDKIIRHLESSIEALVIRKREDPTDELCNIFLSYLDEFDWISTFIKLMRRHGVMLETIIRSYVEDERAEEKKAHDSC